MRRLNLLFAMFMLISIASCALKNISTANVNRTEDTSVSIESTEKSPDYTDLLKTVYEKFVFAIDADSNVYAHPENYFTSNALKKLQNDYEFDCDEGDCYAFYALRTE